MSKKHCTIEFRNNHMHIKDLKVKSLTIQIQTNFSMLLALLSYFKSANGTYVNDAKIELEVKLEVNDRIGFGKFIAFILVTPSHCQFSVIFLARV